jgi:quercetin dioxygenase-like cupin family protein
MKVIAQASQEAYTITPEGAERRVLSHSPQIMLVQFTFAAGITAAMHSHPHEQIGYVVSGAIDLLRDGHEPVKLDAGASYYVEPNLRHGIITHSPTVLIDCFAPSREDFL